MSESDVLAAEPVPNNEVSPPPSIRKNPQPILTSTPLIVMPNIQHNLSPIKVSNIRPDLQVKRTPLIVKSPIFSATRTADNPLIISAVQTHLVTTPQPNVVLSPPKIITVSNPQPVLAQIPTTSFVAPESQVKAPVRTYSKPKTATENPQEAGTSQPQTLKLVTPPKIISMTGSKPANIVNYPQLPKFLHNLLPYTQKLTSGPLPTKLIFQIPQPPKNVQSPQRQLTKVAQVPQSTLPKVAPMPPQSQASKVAPMPPQSQAPKVAPMPPQSQASKVAPMPPQSRAPKVAPMPPQSQAPKVAPMPPQSQAPKVAQTALSAKIGQNTQPQPPKNSKGPRKTVSKNAMQSTREITVVKGGQNYDEATYRSALKSLRSVLCKLERRYNHLVQRCIDIGRIEYKVTVEGMAIDLESMFEDIDNFEVKFDSNLKRMYLAINAMERLHYELTQKMPDHKRPPPLTILGSRESSGSETDKNAKKDEESSSTETSNRNRLIKRMMRQCQLCGLIFPQMRSLRAHISSVHNEEQRKLNAGRPNSYYEYACGLCEQTFQTETSLSLHQASEHSLSVRLNRVIVEEDDPTVEITAGRPLARRSLRPSRLIPFNSVRSRIQPAGKRQRETFPKAPQENPQLHRGSFTYSRKKRKVTFNDTDDGNFEEISAERRKMMAALIESEMDFDCSDSDPIIPLCSLSEKELQAYLSE